MDSEKRIKELQQEFARRGGNPSSATVIKELDRVKSEVERDVARAVARNNEAIPKWLQMARSVAMAFVTIISVLFVFLLLTLLLVGTILLVIAEVAAVNDGFSSIVSHNALLYSVATVGFFLALLFIREIIELNHTRSSARERFSLRHVARRMLYIAGFRDDWKPEYQEHVDLLTRIDNAIRLLAWTIITAGVLGRLIDKVQELPETLTWYQAMKVIVLESSLDDMLGYLTMLLMTAALLFGTHFIIYFVYKTFRENAGDLQSATANFTVLSPEDVRASAILTYWENKLAQLDYKAETQLLSD